MYRQPKKLEPDLWAEETIHLPEGNALPGRLNLDWTPYVRKPLRDLTRQGVEHVILCWSTQIGKTLIGMIAVKYSASVLKRPALHVMPTEPNAEAINVERYQPIIKASPELWSLVDPRRKKEFTRNQTRLNGIWMDFVGARSPGDLASRAKGMLLLDECDKYPDWSGEEADPIELATERTRTYWDRRIYKTSTPTTDIKYIWPELMRSTNERYHVPCPHCGVYQELIWGSKAEGTPGIKWPREVKDPDAIIDDNLAWYECGHCKGKIEDSSKHAMNLKGVWVPDGLRAEMDGSIPGMEEVNPRRSGYHLWAAYSPWVTFSEVVGKFLSCFVRGRVVPAKMQNFVNSWRGLPWVQSQMEVKSEALNALKLPYQMGTLPSGVNVVIHTVDIQEEAGRRYMYYVTRGWGPGGRSWLLDCGRADSWERIADLCRSQYRTRDGRDLQAVACGIDCGYKTDEVYQMCEQLGAIAVKGHRNLSYQYKLSVLDNDVHRVVLHTEFYKDKLHRLIGEHDAFWLPANVTEEYCEHLMAEKKVKEIDKKTGREVFVWKVVPAGAPNHLLDCEVYQLALSEFLGIDKEPETREVVVRERKEVM